MAARKRASKGEEKRKTAKEKVPKEEPRKAKGGKALPTPSRPKVSARKTPKPNQRKTTLPTSKPAKKSVAVQPKKKRVPSGESNRKLTKAQEESLRRSEISIKGWETRRKRERAEERARLKAERDAEILRQERSERAKKAWRKRKRFNKEVDAKVKVVAAEYKRDLEQRYEDERRRREVAWDAAMAETRKDIERALRAHKHFVEVELTDKQVIVKRLKIAEELGEFDETLRALAVEFDKSNGEIYTMWLYAATVN